MNKKQRRFTIIDHKTGLYYSVDWVEGLLIPYKKTSLLKINLKRKLRVYSKLKEGKK